MAQVFSPRRARPCAPNGVAAAPTTMPQSTTLGSGRPDHLVAASTRSTLDFLDEDGLPHRQSRASGRDLDWLERLTLGSAHGGTQAIEFGGIHHLALVCGDMDRTVDFYSNVLGMPLVKTIQLPGAWASISSSTAGAAIALAFFWFPGAPDGGPGNFGPGCPARPRRSHQCRRLHEPRRLHGGAGTHRRVPGSSPGCRDRLHRGGQPRRQRVRHQPTVHPGVFVRSVYFQDPDGILLEFACWTRALRPPRTRNMDPAVVNRVDA